MLDVSGFVGLAAYWVDTWKKRRRPGARMDVVVVCWRHSLGALLLAACVTTLVRWVLEKIALIRVKLCSDELYRSSFERDFNWLAVLWSEEDEFCMNPTVWKLSFVVCCGSYASLINMSKQDEMLPLLASKPHGLRLNFPITINN